MPIPRVRIIRHERVPQTGSFEVRFADGRESVFFYWDDVPSRRLRPELLTRVIGRHYACCRLRKAADKCSPPTA